MPVARTSPASRSRRSARAVPRPSRTKQPAHPSRAAGKQQTRARILASARKLFLRQGFDAVTMRRIASAASVSPGAIYVHFHDKPDVLRALMDQDFTHFEQSLRPIAHEPDPVERLRQCGRAYVRFALAHPHHYRLMFMSDLPCIDPRESSIEHGNPDEDGYAFLRAIVAECINAGRFLPAYSNVERTTQMCWAAAHGVVSLFIAKGGHEWVSFESPLQTADEFLDAHLAGLTGKVSLQDRSTPAPRAVIAANLARTTRADGRPA